MITHNEPWVTAVLGHLTGEHAPGWRNPSAALAAIHHVLLSHGYAVQALRAAANRPLDIGIALNLSPSYPASASEKDKKAVAFTDGFINRIILDPLLKGCYPADFTSSRLWRFLERGVKGPAGKGINPDDLKVISAPLDFIGVNYYTRSVVRHLPLIQSLQIKPKDSQYSQMWEIYPPGIYDLLKRLDADYHHPNLIVTENGVPFEDRVDPEGRVRDEKRIAYLKVHMQHVHRAIQEGVPISGYFVWSLLDNFEWVFGYTRRFGLVYVDFPTCNRIIKDSGRWFAGVIRQNGLEIDG